MAHKMAFVVIAGRPPARTFSCDASLHDIATLPFRLTIHSNKPRPFSDPNPTHSQFMVHTYPCTSARYHALTGQKMRLMRGFGHRMSLPAAELSSCLSTFDGLGQHASSATSDLVVSSTRKCLESCRAPLCLVPLEPPLATRYRCKESIVLRNFSLFHEMNLI